MRSKIDSLVTEKALSLINDTGTDFVVDHILGDQGEAPLKSPEPLPLKNVCAKVSVQLSEEIDKVCDFLGISKRRFLEAAFIDAIEKAHAIIDAEGVEAALASGHDGAQ
jgi:hypothetical protein